MDRKISVSRMVRGVHLIYRLISFSLCFVAIVSAGSGKTVKDIEAYFSDLDSALSALGQKVALSSVKQAKEPMEKILHDYPGIATLIRSNSRGKVINEAVREGKPGRANRNLSRQKWFRKIKSLEPYYSSLKNRKGEHQLFWCKPIRIKKSNRDRCGGAIVARIDLKRSFEAVAKKMESSFRVLQKGQPLFSHSWKASYDTTALPLVIKGLPDILINVKEKKKVVELKPPEPEKKEGSLFKTVTLFVLIGIVLVLLWNIFMAIVKKRQEALLRQIGEPTDITEKSFGDSEENVAVTAVKKAIAVPTNFFKIVTKKGKEALQRRIEGEEPADEQEEPFGEPKKSVFSAAAKAVKGILPKKKEEDLFSETEVGLPPAEKEEVIPEPEEREAEPTVKISQPEAPDAEEKKEDAFILETVPDATEAFQPDFDTAIKDEKPEEEVSEITAAAADETPKTIPPDIMGEVEALLEKHLKKVLAERVKEIEKDVLARVRDELAGRMKDNE